jgi:hypothetical protein
MALLRALLEVLPRRERDVASQLAHPQQDAKRHHRGTARRDGRRRQHQTS